MEDEPEVVFHEQDHPSEVEMWLEDGVVLMRVGTFGPAVESSPAEARRLGLALHELADHESADHAGDSGLRFGGEAASVRSPRAEGREVAADPAVPG